MNCTYMAYELAIQLPFPCSMLPAAPDGVTPDIIVVEGSVPKNLSAPVMKEGNWQIEPGRFLLRGGLRSARFLVEDGCRITMERNRLAEEPRMSVHVMAQVLPVLLQQRGQMILHANTVITAQGAIAVSGESGAGKTTSVAGMLGRGCTLLADDITVLRRNADNQVEAVPGPPHLHLCEDTAEKFGYDISGLPRYSWRRMKAAVPVHDSIATAAVPLRAVYLLKIASTDVLRVTRLSGKEKFAALQECLYGPLIPLEQSKIFALHALVLASVDVYCLERPQRGWSMNEVVEAILHD